MGMNVIRKFGCVAKENENGHDLQLDLVFNTRVAS